MDKEERKKNRKFIRGTRLNKIRQVLSDDDSSKEDYRYAMLLGILELIESQKIN